MKKFFKFFSYDYRGTLDYYKGKKDKLISPLIGFIPKWLTPNILSWTRIWLTTLVLMLFLFKALGFYAFIIIFIAIWLTDIFDGALARSRGLVTAMGALLDKLADRYLYLSFFLGIYFKAHYKLLWPVILIETLALIGFIFAYIFKLNEEKAIRLNSWRWYAEFLILIVIALDLLVF